MRPFSYNTAAELFPAAIRKKKRAGFAYRRFGTAAEAVRFAIEELPADSLNGAYLQVEEARFDQSGIRTLYESEAFPLPRRPRAPEPAPQRQGRRGVSFRCFKRARPRTSFRGRFFVSSRDDRCVDHALARLLVQPALAASARCGRWRGT